MSMPSDRLLKMARRRAGVTQRELSRRSGVPQPTISRIESGRMEPTYQLLDRLLRACGMEVVPIDTQAEDAVDRSLIRSMLELTPEQRFRHAVEASRRVQALVGRARRVS